MQYRFPFFEHIQYYAVSYASAALTLLSFYTSIALRRQVGYYLQFARLPAFQRLLKAAASLSDTFALSPVAAGVTAEGASSDSLAAAAAPDDALERAAAVAALSSELSSMGLSLIELLGLPSLLRTLARMRDYAIATGRVVPPEFTRASLVVSEPLHVSLPAVPSIPAALQEPADVAAAPQPPRLRLKLRVPSAPPAASLAPVQQPDKRKAMRVKGSHKAGAAAAPSAVPDAEDEFDIFTAAMAATEAATMARAAAGPEAMLAELAARIDPSPGAVVAWVSPDPPSALRMHAQSSSVASLPCTLDANPGGTNLPKAAALHLPLSSRPGGFGLYDGSALDALPQADEVRRRLTHTSSRAAVHVLVCPLTLSRCLLLVLGTPMTSL